MLQSCFKVITNIVNILPVLGNKRLHREQTRAKGQEEKALGERAVQYSGAEESEARG